MKAIIGDCLPLLVTPGCPSNTDGTQVFLPVSRTTRIYYVWSRSAGAYNFRIGDSVLEFNVEPLSDAKIKASIDM